MLIPLDKSQDKSMSRQTITQLYSRDNEESLFEEYQVERTPSIAEQFEESLKFRPNWGFIALMITMLWMQGWHYGYGLDTYNRLKHILQARYGYSEDDMSFYAAFISAGFVAGFTFGRLFGSWLVQRDRKFCLLFSVYLSLAAMGIMVIDGIWFFIIGRVLYGAASSIFFAAGGRYIEECSPPKYVSTLVVCYSCGIAFSRAVVLLGLTFLPDEQAG